ncbi:MAG: FtsX-like permease family protein [Pseudarcicella sp.]|nr:FtsX-like permease family protein [Pseudarcicella sp.]MBP6409608.1 FtsX-like permease family protein [Pseudarcicella sp.]
MNIAFFIAKRYFVSKKKKSFISLISNISMLGVGIGTMALVVVLSVFNGLEDFQRTLFKSFDPNLLISSKIGKNFYVDSLLINKIKKIKGVKFVSEVIDEVALIKYRDAQKIVHLKGVDNNLLKNEKFKTGILNGTPVLQQDNIPFAILGAGVYLNLNVSLKDIFTPLEVFYPNNTESKTLNLTSNDAFSKLEIYPSAVFGIEQQYDDNYVFVPLEFAKELFRLPNKRTALEVHTQNQDEIDQIQKELTSLLGSDFIIKNEDQQHEALFRAIKIEKLFVFLTLSFIIAIASFNVFFSLSMLTIEKKDDIKTLQALGCNNGIIKKIFLYEGLLVSLSGAIIGLLAGVVICIFQKQTGFISMGVANGIIDAYPVKIMLIDLFFVALTVITIAFLSSYYPARKASKL